MAAKRVVLFVCAHGAGKSRMAAALFNAAAPRGWWATSAGQEPGEVGAPSRKRSGLLAWEACRFSDGRETHRVRQRAARGT